MKKIFVYIAIVALALASACTTQSWPEAPAEGDIVLSFQFGAPVLTRTAGVGLEDAVNSVDCFFYTDITADPVYSFRDSNPTVTTDQSGNKIYTVSLTAGESGVPELGTLFNNNRCEVFAVFNVPTAITAAPLATIKNKDLANSFAHEGPVAGTSTGSKWVVTTDAENSSATPKYFVMTGQKTLTRSGNNAVTGTVDMKRVPAKIAVDLKIKQEVVDAEGMTWIPMLGGQQIRVYPQNIAGAAIIGGADATPTFPSNLSTFTYKEVVYRSEVPSSDVVDDGTNYVIASQQDFYTYPMTWTRGGDDEPFIKVIVPWRGKSGTTSQKEIYYKVMLPWTSIEANKYYKLTVNVSVLGTEGEPEVTLEPLSAMVVDWQGGDPVNGTVSAAKYLSVDRGVVTATDNYDTAEGRFEFYTPTSGTDFAASDPVTVRIKEIKQQNLKTGDWEYLYQNFNANTTQITNRGYTKAQIDANWVKLVGGTYLEIGHQLNSDLTSPLMDVTPYYYTVVLSLPTDIDSSGEYSKTVTFVQWPEVYVVEDPNTSGSSNNGYAFLNTYTRGDSFTTRYNSRDYTTWLHNDDRTDYEYLGGIHGLTGQNTNTSMYILTVSVSNTYTIGDPRSTTVSNPSFTYAGRNSSTRNHTFDGQWLSAPWTEGTGNNHTLTYYHPSSDQNTKAMIAPKIRVASSYGVCRQGISESNAIARCAAYQEDGIPAGRWRVPTLAEVQFISTLSALGRIPYLFGSNNTSSSNDSYYRTANGWIHINNYTGNVTNNSGQTVSGPIAEEWTRNTPTTGTVRCVYDEWFWGDATENRPLSNKSQFTWGDRNY